MKRRIPLARSPLADGPAEIELADLGEGPPVLVLHGGWGLAYDAFPLDALAPRFRAIAPSRSGYAGSTTIRALPADYHARAAAETLALLDALGVERCALWGASDGAIVALNLALDHPDRFPRIVAEATHLWKRKPSSRAFFETAARSPDELGARVAARLEAEHGARWRDVVRRHGAAWLAIADGARSARDDFYDGRLPTMAADVLVLHGARDPRTEPGELDALREALPRGAATFDVLADGAHSPHSERATAERATRAALAFLGGP